MMIILPFLYYDFFLFYKLFMMIILYESFYAKLLYTMLTTKIINIGDFLIKTYDFSLLPKYIA